MINIFPKKYEHSKRLIVVGLTAVSLLGLAIVQINWINESAKIKEEQFEHRVANALQSIAFEIEDLNYSNRTIISKRGSLNEITTHLKQLNADSLFKRAFELNRINIPYSYSLVTNCNESCDYENIYRCSPCNKLSPNYELRFSFHNKDSFLMKSITPMISITLVCIGLGCWGFISTVRILLRQQKFHELSTDFINNIAHELKTPATTISLAEKMLRKDPDNSSKYLQIIHDENNKLKEQTSRILNLTRLERSEKSVVLNREELNQIIKDVCASFDLRAKARGGEIMLKLSDFGTEIQADVVLIKMMLSNLIDNALKYTKNTPLVQIQTISKDAHVIMTIEDNGIGIKKEDQKHIFDKYYRVKDGDKHQHSGFGIGLALVKKITELHKGDIEVKSNGKGSKFIIRFPTPSK